MFGYDGAVVDPPWPTAMRSPKGEGKSFARHYGAMSFEAIAALPVGSLLKPDAVVLIWCTWPLLLHSGDRHYRGHDAGRSRVGAPGWAKAPSSVTGQFETPYGVAAAFTRFDLAILFLGFALLVLWKHRANIARLLSRTEGKIGTSRNPPS